MSSVCVVVYDKENKQKDYRYMAKDMNGGYVIGYIAIDKPWYSNENEWKYYIIKNEYGSGFCGGASDLGFSKTLVDKETIIPFTQKAEVIYNLSVGIHTKIVKKFIAFGYEPKDNVIRYVKTYEDMNGLWA